MFTATLMLEVPLTLWREICDLFSQNLYKISSDLELAEKIKVLWISIFFVLGEFFSNCKLFFQISKHLMFFDFTVNFFNFKIKIH